jgi:hypothetical protein
MRQVAGNRRDALAQADPPDDLESLLLIAGQVPGPAEHLNYEPEKPPKMEIVKKVAPVYVPTFLMGGITLACIIGAAKVNHRRNVVLASLYSASELAMKEYQAKVIERLGEKKEKEVRDEVTRDHIDQHPVASSQVFITSKGNSLIFDVPSGRYFKGDIEKIRRLEIDINRDLISTFWVPLNEFYYQMEVPSIPLGEDMGWDVDHKLELRISAHLMDDDETCLALDYKVVARQYPF